MRYAFCDFGECGFRCYCRNRAKKEIEPFLKAMQDPENKHAP